MNKSGFSYLELILTLFLGFQLFLVFQLILYQINLSSDNNPDIDLILETYALRIEYQLKEGSNLKISENQLSLDYRGNTYLYYVYRDELSVRFNTARSGILKGIHAVSFQYESPFLYISFTDINNKIYVKRAVIYAKE